ncbi:MAG: hypothetical protein ACPG4T_00115 [Nannocystaceae bacterium]
MFAGGLFACDSGDDETSASDSDGHHDEVPEVDCNANASTIPTFAEVAALDNCTTCHASTLSGGDRSGAPVGVDYDSFADAMMNAEHGVIEVEAGRMPIGSSLSEEDKQDFYLWALCGTPE